MQLIIFYLIILLIYILINKNGASLNNKPRNRDKINF